jgi:hypothetical protein
VLINKQAMNYKKRVFFLYLNPILLLLLTTTVVWFLQQVNSASAEVKLISDVVKSFVKKNSLMGLVINPAHQILSQLLGFAPKHCNYR